MTSSDIHAARMQARKFLTDVMAGKYPDYPMSPERAAVLLDFDADHPTQSDLPHEADLIDMLSLDGPDYESRALSILQDIQAGKSARMMKAEEAAAILDKTAVADGRILMLEGMLNRIWGELEDLKKSKSASHYERMNEIQRRIIATLPRSIE